MASIHQRFRGTRHIEQPKRPVVAAVEPTPEPRVMEPAPPVKKSKRQSKGEPK